MSTVAIQKDGAMAGKRFEVELPEEVLAGFGWQDGEVPLRLREAAVMELLRRNQISEAEAANFLDLNRWELLDLMGIYQVPAIGMTREEWRNELHQEIQRS